jgi:hypothetical protein
VLCLQVQLCSKCYTSLARGDPDAEGLPPPLAICNNWAAIMLSAEIRGMIPTWAELSVCARAQVAVRYEVNGKGRYRLLSHNMVFLNAKPAADSLPRELTSGEYFVVFAKMSDGEVAVGKKKRLLVRKCVTDALRREYRFNLTQYAALPENKAFFAADDDERLLGDLSHNDGDESTLVGDVEEPAQRPGYLPRLNNVEVSTSTAFFGDAPVPTFQVTRSSDLMDHRDPRYDTAVFPGLHSNGQATIYDPTRKVHVSAPEARRHLLSIELRSFAQHPLWTMVNFNNGMKDKGQGLMTVRLNRDPGLARAAFQVTKEQLGALVKQQHDSQRAALSGCPVPPIPPVLRNAQRVMSNLKVVQSSLHGSEEEREDMRRVTYALCFQKGPPHFMLTLTPSELSNGMVAIISSGNDKYVVDDLFKLFELGDAETVRRTAIIQELASKDPAASATYFMEITEFVFRDLLGFDSKKQTSQEGMVGTLDWYAGGVETQGLALLHFHVVVRGKTWPAWLRKPPALDEPAPATASVASDDEEQSAIDPAKEQSAVVPLKDSNGLEPEEIEALVDSLGSATFPVYECFKISPDSSTIICPDCTHSLSAKLLTIFQKSNKIEQEPYVAVCNECGAEWRPSSLRGACVKHVVELLDKDPGHSGPAFIPGEEFAAINISPFRPLPVPKLNVDMVNAVRAMLIRKITLKDSVMRLSTETRLFLKHVVVLTTALGICQEHR